jgi:hypothetical protein
MKPHIWHIESLYTPIIGTRDACVIVCESEEQARRVLRVYEMFQGLPARVFVGKSTWMVNGRTFQVCTKCERPAVWRCRNPCSTCACCGGIEGFGEREEAERRRLVECFGNVEEAVLTCPEHGYRIKVCITPWDRSPTKEGT